MTSWERPREASDFVTPQGTGEPGAMAFVARPNGILGAGRFRPALHGMLASGCSQGSCTAPMRATMVAARPET